MSETAGDDFDGNEAFGAWLVGFLFSEGYAAFAERSGKLVLTELFADIGLP